MIPAHRPLKTDYLNTENGQWQQRNRTYRPDLLLKYIPRFLWPTLEKIRLARLLVTATIGPEWLKILTVTYRTATAAVDLQSHKTRPQDY